MSGQHEDEGVDLQCRDADGEAMQNTCQEVQQHVLSKLGNLTAVCLPDCSLVTPVSLACHCEQLVFWALDAVVHICAMHQHRPTPLLADTSTKLLDVCTSCKSISIGMSQSENATQTYMSAIAVSGNQPDVRLVCQTVLTEGACSKDCCTQINTHSGLCAPANWVGGAKNSTVRSALQSADSR